MKEFGWSLWRNRIGILMTAVISTILAGFALDVFSEYSTFEMFYRMVFVLLEMVFCFFQRERISIILRKDRAHCFYRSMSHAWEKERKRLVCLDVFGASGAAVLLVVGVLRQGSLSEAELPFGMVVFFLLYMVSSRLLACVPYVWILAEFVFGVMFIIMSDMDISPVLCGGTAIVTGVIQVLLYRFLRKMWDTED